MALPLLYSLVRDRLGHVWSGAKHEHSHWCDSLPYPILAPCVTDTSSGGRVLAGLGGAGLYIGVLTLLSVNTTEAERPVYLAMTGLTWGLGTVLGPVCVLC